MVIRYPAKGLETSPYTLTDDDYRIIGRATRACAEFEDIIHLYLCSLASYPHRAANVVLGKMPISAKIKAAKVFAQSRGKEAVERHEGWFESEQFKMLVLVRNAFAHGILLGLSTDGRLAFEMSDVSGIEGDTVRLQTESFSMEDAAALVDDCEDAIPRLEAELMLGSLREKRRAQYLRPHLKSQNRGKQKAKRSTPP